jgi:VanZ family protein
MRFLPMVAVLAVLLLTGLGMDPGRVFPHQDKLHHLLGFFAFAVALRVAFPKLHFIGLMSASAAAALLIELGQALQPDRTPSVADVGASLIGALLGWGSSRSILEWLRNRD